MNHKWIWIMGILMFHENLNKGVVGKDVSVDDGQPVRIRCRSGPGTIIVWFRVLHTSGMEFLASYSYTGVQKTVTPYFSEFFNIKTSNHTTLMLKAFNGRKDSGIYGCGSLVKGSELKFGEVTHLFEGTKNQKTESTTKSTPWLSDQPKQYITSIPCMCSNMNNTGSDLVCDPLLLIPLVSGCGFVILLLLITILYCNRIRTRRCPHHYKRKLGTAAPEKQINRPV